MEQGRDRSPRRYDELSSSVDTPDGASSGQTPDCGVTEQTTSSTRRHTETSMTRSVTLNPPLSSKSPQSSGARPKTLSLASHSSGARPKTSNAGLNSSGARPKTSSARPTSFGARPKKSRKSIPPLEIPSPPEQSQGDDDSISSLLQTLNDLSPLEQESISPKSSTPPKKIPFNRENSYSQQKRVLETVPVPKEFNESSAFCAVQIHLRDELPEFASEENQKLLKTAIRSFFYRNNQLPKASQLLEDIIDSDFQEKNIVKNFAEWGLKQFGGVENFPVFRNPDKNSGAANTSSKSSPNQRHEQIPATRSSGNHYESPQSENINTQEDKVSENNFTQNSQRDSHLTSNTNLPEEESRKENKEIKNHLSRKSSLKSRKENQNQVTRKPSLKKPSQKSLKERLREALQTEREFLRRKLMCSQCGQQEAEVTFLPCSHLVTCSKCASECKTCPTCGAKVLAEAKTFLM